MKALVWFRSDLRTHDNPALRQAFKEAESIEAIFLYSENQLNNHNEANVKVDFLIQNLFSLEKTLSSYINNYKKQWI
jgi:deoxyribodipyrimidine photo-lyase